MRLYILRHGEAEEGLDDDIRHLTSKGEKEAEVAGRFLRQMKVVPDLVLHSPLTRAVQTAQIAARECGVRERDLSEVSCARPSSDPYEFMSIFDAMQMPADNTVLLATHQPFAGALASYMISGASSSSLKITTGTLIGLERSSGRGLWSLFMLMTSKTMSKIL